MSAEKGLGSPESPAKTRTPTLLLLSDEKPTQPNAMDSILYGCSKKAVTDFLTPNLVPCPEATQKLQSLPEGKINIQTRKQ